MRPRPSAGCCAKWQGPTFRASLGANSCTITGARLGPDHLELDIFPEELDSAPVEDPQEAFIESSLYWPDPDKLAAWLAENRHRFRPGTRHLLGQAAWTHRELSGEPARCQPDHRAIAVELAPAGLKRRCRTGRRRSSSRGPISLGTGRLKR